MIVSVFLVHPLLGIDEVCESRLRVVLFFGGQTCFLLGSNDATQSPWSSRIF